MLKNSINMGWIQLRKYYKKIDKCFVYATALLLHPAYRAKYINVNWLEEGDYLHLNQHVQSEQSTKIAQLYQDSSQHEYQINHQRSLIFSAMRSKSQTIMKRRMSLRNSLMVYQHQYSVHRFNNGPVINRELSIHAYIR